MQELDEEESESASRRIEMYKAHANLRKESFNNFNNNKSWVVEWNTTNFLI